jgi:hypothetical protein
MIHLDLREFAHVNLTFIIGRYPWPIKVINITFE